MSKINQNITELMMAALTRVNPDEKFNIYTRLNTFVCTARDITFSKEHIFELTITDQGSTITLDGERVIGWSHYVKKSTCLLDAHHKRLKYREIVGWCVIVFAIISIVYGITRIWF